MKTTSLKRAISLPALVFYGLGTMVGGGFYALLGQVAHSSGMAVPLALAGSGLLAFLSALSFAELSRRYPVSAGPVRYVQAAFGSSRFAAMIGFMVIATGVVSAATLSVATINFVRDFWEPEYPLWAMAALIVCMGLIAARGIGESVFVIVTITALEVGALIYVFAVNADVLAQAPERIAEFSPGHVLNSGWTGVFAGSFLAFYAFIGFEDMVTMAEEVRDVRRALPLGILISVVLATALYVAVSVVAVLAVPVEQLAQSRTPVAELVRSEGGLSVAGLWLVSVLTGINGALVQILMASRVIYGMAGSGQLPAAIGVVNPRTRSPLRATALVTALILALALFFPLATLARITSAIMLFIFASVNLALWYIQKTPETGPQSGLNLPRAVPLFGFLATVGILLFQGWLLWR